MKRTTKVLLVLAWLAIFFIPWLWYDGRELIIGGDLTFPLNPLGYFESIFQLWRRVYTGTHSAISLTTLPFYAPMALADWLGFPLQLVQKIHFGLWLALPALSMFYLTGLIFKDQPRHWVAQLIATSVYLFNSYEVVWADSARMAVWVGLPLMLALFIQGLEDVKSWPSWAATIALASILTSTAAANPPMFIMMAAVFIGWLIFYLFITPAARTKSSLIRISSFILLTSVLALAVNLFWIVPYAKVLLTDYKGALSSGLAGIQFQDWLDPVSSNTSLLNVFRLQGAWDWYAGWQGEPYVPAARIYQEQPFYLGWSVLIPILAFASLLSRKPAIKLRYLYFFAALALLGLFFGAGSHPPTGSTYKWLVERIPFLSIYRSPWYKFSTWTVLGYSILIAHTFVIFLNWFNNRLALTIGERLKIKPTVKTYLTIGLVALFLIANTTYASGLVLGRVFPRQKERKHLHSAHVNFPDYFFTAAEWINQQSGDWRILQLPGHEAFNYRWGLGTLMDMTIFSFKQPTLWWPEQTGSGLAKPGSEQLVKAAYQHFYYETPHLTRLLGWLQIRYLLQKNDIDYGFYGSTETPTLLEQKAKAQDLSPTHQEGPWQFYELPLSVRQNLFNTSSAYLATPAEAEKLVTAIVSPNYEPQVTYGDQLNRDLTDLAQGSVIVPDWSASRYQNGRFTVPFEVPKTGRYRLAFDSAEPLQFTIDSQPVVLTNTGSTYSAAVDLSIGQHELIISRTNPLPNLIIDPSFETGLWPIADATKGNPGPPIFETSLVNEGTDGQRSAKLTSRNHSLALTRGIDQFEPNCYYWLAFDYRHQTGNAPKMSLWQEGANLNEPRAELPINQEWQTYSTVWRPKPLANGAYLFLYADPGNGQPTETTILYDNVAVIKLPSLVQNLTFSSVLPTLPTPPTITYERLSPTRYRLAVANATQPYILNFLEHFDSGWALTNLTTGEAPVHWQSFGYANSWLINKTGNYQLVLEFRPQQLFMGAMSISLVSIALIIWSLYTYRQRRRTK